MIKYGNEYSELQLVFDEPIWMFRSIWSTEIASLAGKYKTLKEYIDAIPQVFYVDSTGDKMVVLYGYDVDLWRSKNAVPFSNYNAYMTFGLERMEEAVERTESVLRKDIFTKRMRKIKLEKLNSL